MSDIVIPSIVRAGPTGLLKPDGVRGLHFLKPSVKEACAQVHALGEIGVVSNAIARLGGYPRICGVEVNFGKNTAVPAHRRIETDKCVTILRGKLALAIYDIEKGWVVHSMSGHPTANEKDCIVIPRNSWHAIVVGYAVSTILVTWKEYEEGGLKPAEWEPDADMLVSGPPFAV